MTVGALLGVSRRIRRAPLARRLLGKAPHAENRVSSWPGAHDRDMPFVPTPRGFPAAGSGARALATTDPPPTTLAGLEVRPLGTTPSAIASALAWLRGAATAIDLADLHAEPGCRAVFLRMAAAAGAPFDRVELTAEERGAIGPSLAAVLATRPPAYGTPEMRREARSVAVRRAALRTVGGRDAAPPAVSVLLATRRPHLWPAVFEMLRSQVDVRLQVVVACHDCGRPDDELLERLRDGVDAVDVLEVGTDRPLGAVLDGAAQLADGTIVAKWDDDDLYGPHHLADLALALDYSGATLAGKASELVTLATGRTLRRFVGGAESDSRSIAGGAFAIRRADLVEVGGFAHLPTGEDTDLIARAAAADGAYRTHGLEFVLRRSGDATWGSSNLRLWLQAQHLVDRDDLRLAGLPDAQTLSE